MRTYKWARSSSRERTAPSAATNTESRSRPGREFPRQRSGSGAHTANRRNDPGAAPADTASGEKTRVLPALKRLSHPFCHRCAQHAAPLVTSRMWKCRRFPSAVGLRYVHGTIFVNASSPQRCARSMDLTISRKESPAHPGDVIAVANRFRASLQQLRKLDFTPSPQVFGCSPGSYCPTSCR